MRVSNWDKAAWLALVSVFILGLIFNDSTAIIVGSLGICIYSVYVQILEAIEKAVLDIKGGAE